MKIKFKSLHQGAILPKKATNGSAAYDLFVPEDVIVKPGRQIIPLGFAMEMEYGYQALVEPRSGFSSKGMEGFEIIDLSILKRSTIQDLIERQILCQGDHLISDTLAEIKTSDRFDCDVIVGKIDSDYRGCVGVIVKNSGRRRFAVKAGTRIAQMTFLKVEDVEWEKIDTLSETDRDGGFGSTGTN